MLPLVSEKDYESVGRLHRMRSRLRTFAMPGSTVHNSHVLLDTRGKKTYSLTCLGLRSFVPWQAGWVKQSSPLTAADMRKGHEKVLRLFLHKA